MAIKIRTLPHLYGTVKVVEGFGDYDLLYVRKTNVKSYIVTKSFPNYTIADMVEVDGHYHFGTLKELETALNA